MYGISNCDTIRKARNWLEEHNIEYRFHDYRKQGLDAAMLAKWCDDFDYNELLNRRGTTWRKLGPDLKENLDRERAIRLMLEHPALIKRPLLVDGDNKILGFDQSRYESLL